MSDPAVEAKLEVKQASKEVKESENVAEKYSAMTVSKNSEMNMGDLSPAFSAVPTHKPVKKVRLQPGTRKTAHWRTIYSLKNVYTAFSFISIVSGAHHLALLSVSGDHWTAWD